MADVGTIRTLGHGTLDASGFTSLVTSAAIDVVVDVRRFPGSRRHPHFGRDAMASWLPEAGVGYEWLEGLGGRRSPAEASPNVGLRNAQFRAYADHMVSDEFAGALGALLERGRRDRLAVMCSESVWWRCHRRLLADHLVLVDGVAVDHLFHDGREVPHPVTPGARRVGDDVVYGSL